MRIRNVFGNRYKGALGKDMVAASWKGHDYIREYVTPANPKSEQQTKQRAIFNQAVQSWKRLSPRQKEFYNRVADGVSGFNVYVGRYIAAVRSSYTPEEPIVMAWNTEDGNPIADAWLIVRHSNRQIFVDNLSDCMGEVALTPADAPYVFVLKKGNTEDVVLSMEDLLEAETPMVLESKLLGIRLVASVQTPPQPPTPPETSAEQAAGGA